ncbi:MAG: nucleotidyltransferase [Actinomycetota bacterium]
MSPLGFHQDSSEFVELLARHDVRYMIVGGYALAAHGLPRATGDLDAWIWTDAGNADRILEALEEFGFGGLGIAHSDLVSPDCVVQLGYPPYRIDLLTQISGVDFEAAWTRHIEVSIGDVKVPVIGREDLIVNKRATGRPQDIADVKRLMKDGA